MKHARLGLLALPLLLAAGCQIPQLPGMKTDTPSATINKSDWPGAPSIAAYTFSDKWSDNSVDRCQFVFTYPELTKPHTWTPEEQPSNPVLDRANKEIMRAYGLISATGTIALNPEEVSAEFMEMCRSDIESMTQELGPESVERMMYVDDSTFTVHMLNADYASLTIETYQYTGGAHGNPGIQAVTLDLATGQRLTLGDVIKNNQLQAVMKAAYVDILKDYEEALFEEARTEINGIVNNTTAMPEAEQREKFGTATNFFLAGEGIMFFWNAYEITPYVAGQPMAFLPWSELEGKLLIKQP